MQNPLHANAEGVLQEFLRVHVLCHMAVIKSYNAHASTAVLCMMWHALVSVGTCLVFGVACLLQDVAGVEVERDVAQEEQVYQQLCS